MTIITCQISLSDIYWSLWPIMNISSPLLALHITHSILPGHNNAGSRGGELLLFMFSIRSHNMLCCVTLSRVITLYKQYHTHPGPSVPHKRTNKDGSPWWWEADESHQNMLQNVFFAYMQLMEKSGKVYYDPKCYSVLLHPSNLSIRFHKSGIQNLDTRYSYLKSLARIKVLIKESKWFKDWNQRSV